MNDEATTSTKLTVGVLALQGAFREHKNILRALNVETIEVRQPAHLEHIDGLIIPGGESTSMGLIAERWGLIEPLRRWVHAGNPTWGTCAGLIMLAERAIGQKQGGQALIGGLDVTVNRNYFGRQVDSFESDLHVTELGEPAFHAVFIRAPAITEWAECVQALALLPAREPGTHIAVAVRQEKILATAFHPELTPDHRWHELFLSMIHQKIHA